MAATGPNLKFLLNIVFLLVVTISSDLRQGKDSCGDDDGKDGTTTTLRPEEEDDACDQSNNSCDDEGTGGDGNPSTRGEPYVEGEGNGNGNGGGKRGKYYK
ncbi:hypothetical protein B5X24_HaOG205110 [Helicoverpa armigera]|uniref:Uncharacterized protein n=1 Tax=Helicoverpa armigera TaxID=29058 RepID=A0A2W1BM49_HELAM|nr:hypothetical protein B5X24_HaOG205110 [Helicoverpa armigera]